jgi:pantetheine-phosphate adenylyltransferase
MKSVIYALSGDPITFGHINIIDRILKMFDHVVVGIGINPQKKYTFTIEEREILTKKVLEKYGTKVTVKSYTGLLADFAYENEIYTIVRGVRNSADFDFEKMLADVNIGFRMNIDTIILVADQSLSHISSSTVKELQKNQAKNVKDYVPLVIKEALESKISGQFLIGVTGSIGSGKSFITKQLVERTNFHYIDMDELGRYILTESQEPLHISIKQTIAKEFGNDLVDKINVKKLLDLMFDSSDSSNVRTKFEKIMEEPMIHLLRKKLINLKGVILINSAIFVESNFCSFVNNNFIFIDCNEEIRIERLKKRGYSLDQISNRFKSQLSSVEKINKIQNLIIEQSCGELLVYNNSDELNDRTISILYHKILEKFKICDLTKINL